jgi:C-terminal processing protease CtpA/Prc
MKINSLSLILLTAFFSMVFVSCEKDDADNSDNSYVNNWIYKTMNVYYYWNNRLPSSPDYSLSPDKFFSSICYWYDKNTNPNGDRFSWIQDNYLDLLNALNGISSDEIGFEYTLYYLDENRVNLIGEIEYVKKGTPAEQKLQRGQYFTEINGTLLTVNNYNTLLSNLRGNYTLSVYNGDDSNLTDKKTVSLSTLSTYKENPIYLDTVYTVNGKNIGYLVYNFFADDSGDGICNYDAQLAQIFTGFKSRNVSSLILDLRYNSGGSTFAATTLASMLVKNPDTKNIFYKLKYNDLITAEWAPDKLNQYFWDEISPDTTWNKLTSPISLTNIGDNLQNFYILTGMNTASASELIINGLKPYMNMTLLGDTTVGKNVASASFYEEKDPKNKWGMQPIIAKMYNKNDESNYTGGFYPDIVNTDNGWDKKQLGDLNENMLNEAVSYIAGGLRSSRTAHKNSFVKVMTSIDKKARSNTSIIKKIK